MKTTTALNFCLTLCVVLYAAKEPHKPRAKELCSRSNTITKPEKKQGKLFETNLKVYEMPRYKYKTGFPTLGIDYMIIKV